MKIKIDFDSSFDDDKPIPIQLGRLYLDKHVVRLAFMPSGKVKMLIPKTAIDDGSIVVSDAFTEEPLGSWDGSIC